MSRVGAILVGLAVFAAGCGSDANGVLEELGLSSSQAKCFTSEYESRGLDLDTVLGARGNELSAQDRDAVVEVASICSAASVDSGTTTSDAEPVDTLNLDPLSLLERAFADEIVASGGTEEGALCILRELEAEGIGVLEFADFGADRKSIDAGLAAIQRCGEDLPGIVDFGFGPDEFDTWDYGDDPFLDRLWDECESGDGGACNELLDASPRGSQYERFADTCGFRSEPGTICTTTLDPAGPPFDYGDDPSLDRLWDKCDSGDGEACDELYRVSAAGSIYEEFADTCGFRSEPGTICTTALDPAGPPFDYGDDPSLDRLWDKCDSGDGEACDELYSISEPDSIYEVYGDTCGFRFEPGRICSTELESSGAPFDYGDDASLDQLWDTCDSGDMAACDELYVFSPVLSAYESHGSRCGGLATEDQLGGCAEALG